MFNTLYIKLVLWIVSTHKISFFQKFVRLQHLSKFAAFCYAHAVMEICSSNHPPLTPKPLEIQQKKFASCRLRLQGMFMQHFIKIEGGRVWTIFRIGPLYIEVTP